MYRVHCMNRISQAGVDQLFGTFAPAQGLEDAEAVMVRSANMHDVELPQDLLAIARAGAGVNNIPIDECTNRGIVVFNTPGANANGVKEMVIAGMLLASRDILGSTRWVAEHADTPDIATAAEKAKAQFGGTELAGKTLGVIGLGAIGAMVANTGRSLGMHVLGYDPYLSVKYAWSLDRHVHAVRNLGDIFSQADFVTIHVPASDKTRNMIGRDQIAQMKRGVVVLNFARDILVDEKAMADALTSGHVSRYVTDFANPLTTHMPNTIVTSHLGASTVEAEDNCAAMAISELRDYLLSGNITNSVNFGDVDLGPIETDERIVVLHRNVPNMIGSFSQILTDTKLNIENMANKRRGEVATTLLETSGPWDDSVIDRICGINGVFRARMIPGR
ncbi:MAG: 3-phosphoglycerate dehydrogenase family protein [Coriobacteriales bacterium]|nr:3-phosphoglycerate dehydrogenase family protein [Coriobacteriales bacterium]